MLGAFFFVGEQLASRSRRPLRGPRRASACRQADAFAPCCPSRRTRNSGDAPKTASPSVLDEEHVRRGIARANLAVEVERAPPSISAREPDADLQLVDVAFVDDAAFARATRSRNVGRSIDCVTVPRTRSRRDVDGAPSSSFATTRRDARSTPGSSALVAREPDQASRVREVIEDDPRPGNDDERVGERDVGRRLRADPFERRAPHRR